MYFLRNNKIYIRLSENLNFVYKVDCLKLKKLTLTQVLEHTYTNVQQKKISFLI